MSLKNVLKAKWLRVCVFKPKWYKNIYQITQGHCTVNENIYHISNDIFNIRVIEEVVLYQTHNQHITISATQKHILLPFWGNACFKDCKDLFMKRFQFASGDHEVVRCFVTLPARLCNKRGIVPEIRKKNGKTCPKDLYDYNAFWKDG